MMKFLRECLVRARRQHDESFKREAVLNWINSGKPPTAVAEELGMAADRLYAWRKGPAPLAPGEAAAGDRPDSLADLQSQIDPNRWENRNPPEQCTVPT